MFVVEVAARIYVQEEGESPPNTRRSRPSLKHGPSLCATLLNWWWCWRDLPAAISTFVKLLNFTDHHPIRIRDERERLVNTSPVM
jgi:hypothetical protein